MKELWRAWRIRQRRESKRLGRIAAILVNVNRKKGTQAVDSEDFCEIEEEDEDDDPS